MLNISKLFTWVIILYPVLSIYGIGIASITLADSLLLLLYPFLLFFRINRRELSYPFFIFLLYICFQYAFLSLTLESSEVLLRTLRYSLYIFTLFWGKTYFSLNYGCRLLGKVARIATYFLVLQFIVFHLFGYYIPGYVSFFPVLRDELLEFTSYVGTDGGDIRMRSFFGEPAHYAQYVLCYLFVLMFDSNKKDKEKFLISCGIVLSGSTTGICLMILLWFVILYQKYSMRRLCGIIVCLIFILGGLIFFCGQELMILLDNWLGVNPLLKFTSENLIRGRLGSYDVIKGCDFSLFNWIFGHGMETSFPVYLPGFLMLFWYFGLVGLFLYFSINMWLFVNGGFTTRVGIIVFALLNIGSEAVLGPFVLLYFMFILSIGKQYLNRRTCICYNYESIAGCK